MAGSLPSAPAINAATTSLPLPPRRQSNPQCHVPHPYARHHAGVHLSPLVARNAVSVASPRTPTLNHNAPLHPHRDPRAAKDGGARGGGRARRCGRFLIVRWCGVSRSGIRPSTFHPNSPHADLASLLSRGLGSFHGLPGLSIAFYPRVIGGIACTWSASCIDLASSGLCGGMDALRRSLALPAARWAPPMSAVIAHVPPTSAHGHGGGIVAGCDSIRHDRACGGRTRSCGCPWMLIGIAAARARVWVGDYRVQSFTPTFQNLDCGSTNEMGVRALWMDACMRERDVFEKFLDG
ncbi:hypothetical protein B0H13DRAFT_1916591 [Mycena leptocephala]|nr:hypothetical protein B0H13DRAFT_1916591 [Mycena leptocephala]